MDYNSKASHALEGISQKAEELRADIIMLLKLIKDPVLEEKVSTAMVHVSNAENLLRELKEALYCRR